MHTSLFTNALLAGLNGAADAGTTVRLKDGVITLSELHDHVTYQVNRDRIEARWNRNITPQLRAIGDSEGAFFFINPEVVEDADRGSPLVLDLPVTPPPASAKGGDRLAALAVTTGGGEGPTPEARIYGTPEPGFRDCPTCPEMIWLPPGRFTMGSPVTEPGRSNDEGPLHWVDVAPFAIARTEVTFDQWMACVADQVCGFVPDDNGWGRGARPVINVTFAEAMTYISWLNSKVAAAGSAGPYRLPSEAEWEYAARAGVTHAYPWGETWDAKMANGREGETITPDLVRRAAEGPESKAAEGVASLLEELSGGGIGGFGEPGAAEDFQARTDQLMVDMFRGLMRGDRVDIEELLRDVGKSETKPVGSFPANAWGLLDMIGNVSEWTEDCWSDTYHGAPLDARAATEGGPCPGRKRVARGGSGIETPPLLRSAQRFSMAESFAIPWLGFRPARSLEASVTAE